MSTDQPDATRGPLPSELLRGMSLARRPTGPIVAILVVVLAFVIGQTLGVIVLVPLLGAELRVVGGGSMSLADQLAFTLAFLGPALLLFVWVRWKERRPFSSVGFLPAQRIGGSILLGVAVAVVLMSVPVLLNVLLGQAHFDSSDGGLFHAAQLGAVVLALVGFTIQASTEEVFTRGYLLQATFRKWGLVAAVIVQMLVFTVLHALNGGLALFPLLNLILVGLLLALWALAEGSLWGVCAFHAVWNWMQGNVYGVPVSNLKLEASLLSFRTNEDSAAVLTGGGFGIEGSAFTTVLLLVSAGVAFRAYRRRSGA
ncbi:CAAX amino protease [Longimycelium tulufanense]|uniref:CAAX amino protease n=1 Tax=Longimycelium tulufanense TaxID=907463 RepID=A0A8J3C7Q8_9PSEU|nr:type II CAAX endopeptidase family protein [Longimycelium tulufanense]GGM50065.1 CAAX amino protease [Longimycelium tulufanense]